MRHSGASLPGVQKDGRICTWLGRNYAVNSSFISSTFDVCDFTTN